MPYFNSVAIATSLGITLPHEISDIETVCETLEQELKNMGIIYEDTPTPRKFKLRGSVNGKSLFQFPANLQINSIQLKKYTSDTVIRQILPASYNPITLPYGKNPIHIIELIANCWVEYDNYLEIIAQGGFGTTADIPSSLVTLCKLESMALINAMRSSTQRNVQQTVSSTTIGKVSTSFKSSNSTESQIEAINKLRRTIFANHGIL